MTTALQMLEAPAQSVTEEEILSGLAIESYENLSKRLNISRGRIYNVALKHGARKTEARIRERAMERRKRQSEFLQEVINTTSKADVLDYLDSLPDESVDLHLTSIPYNVGKAYGNAAGADNKRFHFWMGHILQCLSEAERTLRQGGVLFLQVGQTIGPNGKTLYPIDTLFFSHLEAMGLTYQNRITWKIPHGLTPKNRLAERSEVALVFSKGALPRTFNPTPARTPQKQPGKRFYRGVNKGLISSHPLGAWPSNVWDDIPAVGHNHPEKSLGDSHPAQFPGKLARRAILLYTGVGDVVADIFSGTGTTAAEAKRAGRAFLGCDLFYEDTRAKRLAQIVPDLVCPLPGVTDESIAIWQAEARAVQIPAQHFTAQQEMQLMLQEFGDAVLESQ